jgi:hypothetical protein
MSRQLDAAAEDREEARRMKLIRAVEFGLVDTLENMGAELRGFSLVYAEFSCLLTLKADFNGVRHVSFVATDSIMNCLIKADTDAATNSLRWKPDKYHKPPT